MRAFALSVLFLPVVASAELHHVEISGVKFVPDTLEVRVGDEVIWENKDLVPHTVTADNKSFNSKQLDTGKTFKLKVKKAGEFSYKCSFHPVMTAKLIVKPKPK